MPKFLGLGSRPAVEVVYVVTDSSSIRDKMQEVNSPAQRSVNPVGQRKLKDDELKNLIDSDNRKFPVVVFSGGRDGWMYEFDIDFFARLVGYYCHVRSIDDPDVEHMMADDYGLDRERINDSITVFYKGSAPQISYKSDISDTTFEVIKLERKKYWNENGCRAFRRKLVSEIREDNARQAEKNRDNSVC